jgi:hypothetical protein
MKRILLLLVVFTTALTAVAQRTITGTIVEKDSKEAAVSATVALLSKDSTVIANSLTGNDGHFKFTAPRDGQYTIKVTYVGFKTLRRTIRVSDGNPVNLGTLSVQPDAIMLKETTVTGHMAKVTVKEDTFVYNAGAYRTPEGSVVEELVKKLPGAQVGDDGTITINGKTVKKILVDGKEFMTGDTKVAMKNLPTSVVEKVKAYDEKSDLARISGIDDGDETTVLDFGLKKGMNRGMFANADAGVGTKDRYSGKLMGAYMRDNTRMMGFANANNVNDMGFPGGGGGGRFGGGRNGLTSAKMVATNFNYEIKDKLKLDGNVRWNHNDGDAWNRSSTQNFVSTTNSYGNSISQNYSRGNNWDAQMRVEWQPDTMTTITFRPQMSLSSSDGLGTSTSATFADDPYLYAENPLLATAIAEMRAKNDTLVVNSNDRTSLSYSDSKSVSGMLQYNRKLNSMGRNLTLQLRAGYTDNQSKSLSNSDVWLYLKKTASGTDSTYQTNRYNIQPQKSYNYSARLTYSEPIMKATFLQFSYEFQYKHNTSTRSTYDFSWYGDGNANNAIPSRLTGITPAYRDWNSYLSQLPNSYESYYDQNLSRYSSYDNYIHTIEVMLRIIRKTYNFNVGVTIMPQTTKFEQNYLSVDTAVTRNVFNVSPTLDFRWKRSKVSQLRFMYRGSTSQPSITQLLDITDNSNQLNISKGNPGLKPSYTNNFRLFYNDANMENHQRAIWASLNFQATNNAISNKVYYDTQTGGRITQPENINGNWSAGGNFMFNTAIDTAAYFNINTTTNINYENQVGYYQPSVTASSERNTTRTLSIYEKLATSYRNDWIEFEPNGTVTYNHSRNALMSNVNLDTWQFSYGFNTNITLPWGTSLSTDLSMNSRRGYNDASMNTNELIWNAQLSQGFLTGKPLTVSLQFYDLLHQQSTISRTISAMQRSDVEYNSIASYAMLHVIYRLNLFGTKEMRRGMHPGGPDGDGPQMYRGNRGNGNGNKGGGRGGFGGGGFGGPGPM